MPNLRWTDDGKRSAAVCERDFTIERRGNPIPGVVWQPLRATGARPLVLMGDGGTGDKRSAKMSAHGGDLHHGLRLVGSGHRRTGARRPRFGHRRRIAYRADVDAPDCGAGHDL